MSDTTNAKAPYQAPTMTTMDSSEVLEALGPAQGMSSGVSSGPVVGPDGLTDMVTPGNPRTLGRR